MENISWDEFQGVRLMAKRVKVLNLDDGEFGMISLTLLSPS